MTRNPFAKYLTQEDHLQHQVMTYINVAYPNAVAIHVPNEGKRSKFEQFKALYLGMTKGVHDVLIFTPNKHYNGLSLELKVKYANGRKNTLTPAQTEFGCNMLKSYWLAKWAYSFDEAMKIIDDYMATAKYHDLDKDELNF